MNKILGAALILCVFIGAGSVSILIASALPPTEEIEYELPNTTTSQANWAESKTANELQLIRIELEKLVRLLESKQELK